MFQCRNHHGIAQCEQSKKDQRFRVGLEIRLAHRGSKTQEIHPRQNCHGPQGIGCEIPHGQGRKRANQKQAICFCDVKIGPLPIGQTSNEQSDRARHTDRPRPGTTATSKLGHKNQTRGDTPNHPGKNMGPDLVLQNRAYVRQKSCQSQRNGQAGQKEIAVEIFFQKVFSRVLCKSNAMLPHPRAPLGSKFRQAFETPHDKI